MAGFAAPPASFVASHFAFAPVAGPTTSFRTQVCGSRCWIAAKIKLRKALKRHGWQLHRKLDAQGDENIPGYMNITSVTDSGNEVASTSSDALDSSIVQKEPMHLILDPPGTYPSVPAETSSLFDGMSNNEPALSIAVIGATGELARSKVFPALFALYYSGFLPQDVSIFGYSRKAITDEGLRSMIEANLTCRVDHQYVLLMEGVRAWLHN